MERVWPDFVHQAAVERVIIRNCVTFLNARSRVTIDYGDPAYTVPPDTASVSTYPLAPGFHALS